MFHIYSPALSVYLVSENEGFKPKVLTQRIRKVKRATPEGAARNIESIWEERYSIKGSGEGEPYGVKFAYYGVTQKPLICNAAMRHAHGSFRYWMTRL